MTFRLVGGDAIQAMQSMAESSVDAIVTDPPYGLSFMGKTWDRNLDHGLWATEALRILKPGGHLLAFGGTRTYHRLACAIEDAGFEIRDCLAWMYGSGFPKSLNIGDGMGTALKPAFEPIVLARKPLAERNVAANVQRWGTGALNIDGCRIGTDEHLGREQTPNMGGAFTFNGFSTLVELQAAAAADGRTPNGRSARATLEKALLRTTPEPPAGRWPANVTLDETAAAMLDEQTGEWGGGLVKPYTRASHDYYYSGSWPDSNGGGYDDTGGASRFFYCPKADREERNRGHGANLHPTVKPVELMRWLCRMVTPKGGTVLDPFTGSGSTGVAAMREGFEFIGIEREAEYVEIARARIIGDAPLFNVEMVGGGPTE